jgi:hypothetical protein
MKGHRGLYSSFVTSLASVLRSYVVHSYVANYDESLTEYAQVCLIIIYRFFIVLPPV